ncbi:BadF/BadG/BcrA/BcrD ATPase family protein [Phaeobacter sp.]|uniref:BadF/BadG/BcrA/BcrD ATPase family protein n=1 Tax=Phaeobacter sp. TaxID=1902409 RepID=UPI0025E0A60C|nr:BadF/BadG/BcrA/BcrD ATPase family protein [Phaeobacter sp.]
MLDPALNPVLAVDGGGSHCRLVLANDTRQISIQTGPANVTSDRAAALAQITDGLQQLATAAEISTDALHTLPAYFGLAGVTSTQIAQDIAAALPCPHARVEEDRAAALAGAHGLCQTRRDGALAHCGTGSFLGLQLGASRRFAGGWGPVLGDPASAPWLVRQILARCLDCCDGLYTHSALTQHLLAELGGSDGIIAFAQTTSPSVMGQLAQQITTAATAGDSHAITVLETGAARLLADLQRLGWLADTPLCLTGGVGPQLALYLPQAVQAKLLPPLATPLEGALILARQFRAELQTKGEL